MKWDMVCELFTGIFVDSKIRCTTCDITQIMSIDQFEKNKKKLDKATMLACIGCLSNVMLLC
jgi:hypothetical protein